MKGSIQSNLNKIEKIKQNAEEEKIFSQHLNGKIDKLTLMLSRFRETMDMKMQEMKEEIDQ